MDYKAAKKFILKKLQRELSDELTYHGLHHTLDVLHSVEELCMLENIPLYEALLVKTAALFHDTGFIIGSHRHEEYSCEIASHYLPQFDYTADEIARINTMIRATKIPQQPQDKLSQLLCDADLDYLGRDDFYRIGATLFEELRMRAVVEEEESWQKIQISFLEQHRFFTATNQRRRAPKKALFLEELKAAQTISQKN